MTHRDVARRICKFFIDAADARPSSTIGDDLSLFFDRFDFVGPDGAREDVVARILYECYGKRDADGIVRPEIP